LIEDNEADIFLTQEAFEEFAVDYELSVVKDGYEAVDLLNSNYIPQLILLDLNLPFMDGATFLKTIRENRSYSSIPVIVLTTSSSTNDIEKCYNYFANSYIVKPLNLDNFYQLIEGISDLWLNKIKLPGENNEC